MQGSRAGQLWRVRPESSNQVTEPDKSVSDFQSLHLEGFKKRSPSEVTLSTPRRSAATLRRLQASEISHWLQTAAQNGSVTNSAVAKHILCASFEWLSLLVRGRE